MRRSTSRLAFAIGFIGVLALASGWSTTAASLNRDTHAYGARLTPDAVQPYVATHFTIAAARSALYFINARAYPDTLPSNPSHTSFGRLMPDGTYCGVGCRTTDSNH